MIQRDQNNNHEYLNISKTNFEIYKQRVFEQITIHFFDSTIKKISNDIKKLIKKKKRLQYLREKYRDLFNKKIKQIFDLKKQLNTQKKKTFEIIKYLNSNDKIYRSTQRFKLVKRVTISIFNIIIFKTITFVTLYRNISITNNFKIIIINVKFNNKYLDISKFKKTKNNKFYKN